MRKGLFYLTEVIPQEIFKDIPNWIKMSVEQKETADLLSEAHSQNSCKLLQISAESILIALLSAKGGKVYTLHKIKYLKENLLLVSVEMSDSIVEACDILYFDGKDIGYPDVHLCEEDYIRLEGAHKKVFDFCIKELEIEGYDVVTIAKEV